MEQSIQISNPVQVPAQTADDPVVAEQAKNLTKAIFQHESGLNYNAIGDAGTSKGAGQWQAATWKAQAKDVLGDENAPMTPENQSIVAQGTIRKLIKQGKNAAQIAAIWNSGSDKNWENKVGKTTINGQQISYNVPKYVKDVTDLYQQYKGQTTPTPQAPQDQGFVQNVGSDLSQRAQQASGAIGQASQGVGELLSGQERKALEDIGSGTLQTAGSIAGGVSDLANTVLTHLPIVGGAIKGGEEAIGQATQAIAQTPTGQSAINAYNQLPEEWRANIGAATNIASLIPIFKAPGLALDGIKSAATKGVLGAAAKSVADKAVLSEALDVVAPKETAASIRNAIQSGKGTTGGLMGRVSLDANRDTLDAAAAIKPLVEKGVVGSEKTAVENANVIRTEIGKEAENLKTQLATQEIKPIIDAEDLQNLQHDIQGQLSESPLMVGDAEITGNRIVQKFLTFLPTGRDITAEDILSARQRLDSWARSQRSKIFDATNQNAQTTALRIIRNSANKLMAEKAPSVGVKTSLARQSALYDALENIAAKGTKEVGTTRFTRFGQRHPVLRGAYRTVRRGALMGAGLKGVEDLIP